VTAQDVTPAQLSMMLADDIEAVVRELGIDVRSQDRRRLYCFAPWNGHHKPKLEIELQPMPGKWNDWIEGRYGDALGLVGCVLTGQSDPRTKDARSQGVRWAKERFGIGTTAFDRQAFERRRAEAAARARKRAAEAKAQLARHRAMAKALWINAKPLRPTSSTERGCPGARYLEARGIDFARLGRLPRAIHFSPRETWHGPDDQEHVGPALLSGMTLVDGTFASLHRIWIDPEREGEKADLDPPRKMWPDSQGAAIRLWRGLNHLSETDAIARGVKMPLVVCEGVEDGLSIAMMTPEHRVHAAGSLPGLWSYDPPDCVSELIVAADNDWDKPQAQALLKRSIERLTKIGASRTPPFAVGIARSPEGKDFNDLLRGA
jgi:hypothetical protein